MAKKIQQIPRPASSGAASLQEIGTWIRVRRTELKLRIDDAAALCGVSVALLSALENGTRPVGMDKLLQVARNLGLVLSFRPAEEQASSEAVRGENGKR